MFSWEPTTPCSTTARRGLALRSRPKREPRGGADACAGSCVLTYPGMCVNMLLTCLKMLSETRENVCQF
jgi:hypothetical protein